MEIFTALMNSGLGGSNERPRAIQPSQVTVRSVANAPSYGQQKMQSTAVNLSVFGTRGIANFSLGFFPQVLFLPILFPVTAFGNAVMDDSYQNAEAGTSLVLLVPLLGSCEMHQNF